jgi:four helix bundle protein
MDFKELLAYKKSFELAMEIFEISKAFPKKERYSLTDQLCRSSRSTVANIAESYRKSIEIGKLINFMINNPTKFGVAN